MLRKLMALVMLGAMTLMSCSPSTWQDFKTNPVEKTDNILDLVGALQGVAVVTFGQLKPLLPEGLQDSYQAKFNQSLVALDAARVSVHSAVQAAAAANEEKPDFGAVLATVYQAIKDVKAVVDEVRDLLKSAKALTPPAADASYENFVKLEGLIDKAK